MTRHLLVTDRYDGPAIHQASQRATEGATSDILLLGRSNGWFRWLHGQAPDGCRLVDPVPHGAEVADRVGAFLVDLVEQLPRRELAGETLAALLRTADGTAWWDLDITEKGPFRSPLVSQLYRLGLARAVIDGGAYDEVTVEIADELVADTFRLNMGGNVRIAAGPGREKRRWRGRNPLIRYWLHAAVVAARLVGIRAFLAAMGLRADGAPRGLAAFTFFPAWWSRPFTAGAADRFFSHLGDGETTGYLAWMTSVRTLWRRPRAAARTIRARRLMPLQTYLGLRDLLAVLSVRQFRRVRRFERRLRQAMHEPFAGFDVGPLVAADISRSLIGTDRWLAMLLARAVRRAAAANAPRWLLYRLEFQPFENALMLGLRGRARGIGFLHYPFGRHYLSTRFAAGEVSRYLDCADADQGRPLPDGILACGEVGIAHVAASGYPAGRCAVCGPQRFGRLVDYRRSPESRDSARRRLGLPLDRPVYLVTLAIVEEDTEALFGALARGLDDAADPLLVVRTHPNRPLGDPALASALARLGQRRAVVMDPHHDLYDYLRASDALICIGSMIAFEAIALDRMPVVFENPSTFPALSLAEFSEGLFVARDEDELRSALGAICQQGEAVRARQARWPALLSRVLGDLETPLPIQLTRALARLDDAPRGVGFQPAPEAGVT